MGLWVVLRGAYYKSQLESSLVHIPAIIQYITSFRTLQSPHHQEGPHQMLFSTLNLTDTRNVGQTHLSSFITHSFKIHVHCRLSWSSSHSHPGIQVNKGLTLLTHYWWLLDTLYLPTVSSKLKLWQELTHWFSPVDWSKDDGYDLRWIFIWASDISVCSYMVLPWTCQTF